MKKLLQKQRKGNEDKQMLLGKYDYLLSFFCEFKLKRDKKEETVD